MKNRCWLLTGLCIAMAIVMGTPHGYAADAAAGAAALAPAESVTPTVAFGAETRSAYLYRGGVINDGFVLQPWLDATLNDFTIGFWGNMDLEDYDGFFQEGRFSEMDIYLTYAFEVAGLNASIAFAEYLFPNVTLPANPDVSGSREQAWPGTREVILKAGRELPSDLSAEIALSYDVDFTSDLYIALKLMYKHAVTPRITVKAHALGAYITRHLTHDEETLYGITDEESGFNDYDLRVGVDYALTKAVSLSVLGGYTGSLDRDVRQDPSVNGYGGLGLSAGF